MDISVFIKWFISGFLVAIPVWPISLLVIEKTLKRSTISGFSIWLWAWLWDFFFASVSLFWISIISDFLLDYQMPIRIIWILFLIYIWIKNILDDKDHSKDESMKITKTDFFKDLFTTFFLVLSNPLTIIFFWLLFSALGFQDSYNFVSSLFLAISLFLGSLFWYLILILITNFTKSKLQWNIISKITKSAWFLMIFLSLYLLFETFYK